MRGYVSRTFIESTIYSEIIEIVGGKIETDPLSAVTVEGKVTNEKAIKIVKKAYNISGNVIVNITEINETSKLLGVPIEKFREIAVEIKQEDEETF